MSHLHRKIRASWGVAYFLDKTYGIKVHGNKLNKIMILFMRSRGAPYQRWKSGYKGLNTADVENALYVQENWKAFVSFVEKEIDAIKEIAKQKKNG